MTDALKLADAMAARSMNANRRFIFSFEGADRDLIVAALRAHPQNLTGCLHPDHCPIRGRCASASCDHYGKTWYGPRMTLEAQVDGILYPNKGTT